VNRETVYRRRRPKAWMIWVKLDCLKSNGKLETEYSLDTTVTVKTRRQQIEIVGLWNPSSREQRSVRSIKPWMDTLPHPITSHMTVQRNRLRGASPMVMEAP